MTKKNRPPQPPPPPMPTLNERGIRFVAYVFEVRRGKAVFRWRSRPCQTIEDAVSCFELAPAEWRPPSLSWLRHAAIGGLMRSNVFRVAASDRPLQWEVRRVRRRPDRSR